VRLFHGDKSDISAVFVKSDQVFSKALEAALGMTTPHPQSLSPLRGEGSQ